MTSFGLGEIGIVVLIALVFFDSKQVGKAVKWFRELKLKIFHVQKDFKEQMDKLIDESEIQEEIKDLTESKSDMRDWGLDQISHLSAEEKSEAGVKILFQIKKFPAYPSAASIAVYASLKDELETKNILEDILAEGKSLLLPYIESGKLSFARVEDLQKDIEPGNFGIREPIKSLRKPPETGPELILVPGRCFDESGARIGRGKGFYDKYLQNNPVHKVGICFDVQISGKKLNMQEHDVQMDSVISEKRIIEIKKV